MNKTAEHLSHVIMICLAVFSVLCILFLDLFLYYPIVKNQDLHYFLHQGTTASELAYDLQMMTHLDHPLLFKIAVRCKGVDHQLRAGEYVFSQGSSIHSILNQLVHGQVVLHALTIVNGWTSDDALELVRQSPFLKPTLKNKTRRAIRKALDIQQQSIEGWFYPETYHFPRQTRDIAFLKRAHQAMKHYLDKAWQARAPHLPYRYAYEALIVASMLEKETSIKREKPLIAAIILKRLKKKMYLQIDATVIYGLGARFNGHLTHQDMHLKTPYNTYTRHGLPPTPIAIPGGDSIDAALHPAQTKALYFVAKGDGTHVFSKTLRQHEKAIMLLQQSH